MYTRLFCFLLAGSCTLGHAEITSENNERLKQGLALYPAADTDKDGILTMAEAKAFLAQKKAVPASPVKAGALKPDAADVAYGPHERNKLDIYLAKGATGPTPVVVMIHGGGFRNGDKSRWAGEKTMQELLGKGISCVAINYPFLTDKPVQDILRDCGRAVQFLRAHADEWKLDKTRFAAIGGSAGAGTSLWLATRDDLADPKSADPVLRESTRLSCAVCNATQATYDVSRWESFMGPTKPEFGTSEMEAALFYHLPSIESFQTDSGKAILKECDMLSWITRDDPPLLVNNSQVVEAPTNRGEWLHCIHHAREVHKVCAAAEVPCIVLQDQEEPKTNAADFLAQHLITAGPKG
ncbi:alpha/beta hydrolase family protein [Prosthecobacter fusiformis]|uniref:Alpha/beta hydrolase family protein n=1 Tax=Prosthecobacter fusiformis TaxID=48464 RepID=A0A4R7S1A1_9BACT|nr:alpha/beta hydrolase [Prosthecobacter fusiformis]TDU70965.1 alpha/beta hydrolase family protein [Prosthecobacter fusiformis]